tara:strand:- start:172 stop:399 length:228 start_codon:yes stop_codon:yes gene_type:complete
MDLKKRRREIFKEKIKDKTPEDIQKEILYNLELNNEILENNRKNTKHIVDYAIAFPYIFLGIYLLYLAVTLLRQL